MNQSALAGVFHTVIVVAFLAVYVITRDHDALAFAVSYAVAAPVATGVQAAATKLTS